MLVFVCQSEALKFERRLEIIPLVIDEDVWNENVNVICVEILACQAFKAQ